MKEWKDSLKQDENNEKNSAINGTSPSDTDPKDANDVDANHTGETNNNEETTSTSTAHEEKATTINKKPGSGGKVST